MPGTPPPDASPSSEQPRSSVPPAWQTSGAPPPWQSDAPVQLGQVQTSWPDAPAGPPPPKHGPFAVFKELPVLIIIAFGLALLIKTFLVQAFFIPSESMVPTLQVKDRVLVNKLVYRFREPRRGEIMVFVAERDQRPRSFPRKVWDFLTEGLGAQQPGERDFIKRVIGLPGETLSFRNSKVRITKTDGSKITLNEPYAVDDARPYGPFKVPSEQYFVMGDNRPNSSDSRFTLGPIKRSDIVGKAFVRIWPLRRVALFKAPSYEAAAKAAAVSPVLAGVPAALWFARRRRTARRAA